MSLTTSLILCNIVVFLAQGMLGSSLIAQFALWPIGSVAIAGLDDPVGFRPWQLVTSAFLHGSTTHLVINMFALYMFGREVEARLGSARYAWMYGASVVTAAITQLLFVTATGGFHPTVGASGGVFGILLAFGYLFPERRVVLLFPPIPMRARTFVILYGAMELLHGILGTQEGVAHFAHLGGMLGAWVVLWRWRRRAA